MKERAIRIGEGTLIAVVPIVLALIAARLASLPAAGRRTFGYQRSEVLAALVNGLLLVVVSVAVASCSPSAARRRRNTSTSAWRNP